MKNSYWLYLGGQKYIVHGYKKKKIAYSFKKDKIKVYEYKEKSKMISTEKINKKLYDYTEKTKIIYNLCYK